MVAVAVRLAASHLDMHLHTHIAHTLGDTVKPFPMVKRERERNRKLERKTGPVSCSVQTSKEALHLSRTPRERRKEGGKG